MFHQVLRCILYDPSDIVYANQKGGGEEKEQRIGCMCKL